MSQGPAEHMHPRRNQTTLPPRVQAEPGQRTGQKCAEGATLCLYRQRPLQAMVEADREERDGQVQLRVAGPAELSTHKEVQAHRG